MRTVLACLLIHALVPLARAQTTYPCDATPGIREALEAVTGQEATSYEDRLQRRLAGLTALLKKHHGDFFVRQAHASLLPSIDWERDHGIAEYRELLEQRPDDPLRLYYYARVLVGRNTPEAIAKLSLAIEKAPQFAHPHLLLGEIYEYRNFRDKEKQRHALEEFVRLCPESLSAYGRISGMDRSPFVETSAVRLRTMLEGRSDRQAIWAYGSLWRMEFKLAPPAGHAALRKRVEADIERIKRSKAFSEDAFPFVLASGYKLIGKSDEATQLEERAALAFYRAQSDFHKNHPFPKQGDPLEKRQEYNRALLRASNEWMAKWPEEPAIYSLRLGAMGVVADVPAAEIEATCDKLLALKATRPGSAWEMPVQIRVAQTYVQNGVRLDRVPELVKQGLTELDQPPVMSDLYPQSKSSADDMQFSRRQWRFNAWNAWAEAAIRSDMPSAAGAPLASMRDLLAANKPADSAPVWHKTAYAGNERTHSRRMGELAEKENRKLDALAWYGKLLASMPEANKEGREKMTTKLREIWLALGGTGEAWMAWRVGGMPTRSAPAPSGGPQWTKLDKPLPKFDVIDIQGKKWTQAELKGKTTFLAVWASW
ncbi:MAG: hypothetical protein HY820_32200 [Acidobacteria bacterium]|nr:hypothetical protein [Acidobacteriota bacterium]